MLTSCKSKREKWLDKDGVEGFYCKILILNAFLCCLLYIWCKYVCLHLQVFPGGSRQVFSGHPVQPRSRSVLWEQSQGFPKAPEPGGSQMGLYLHADPGSKQQGGPNFITPFQIHRHHTATEMPLNALQYTANASHCNLKIVHHYYKYLLLSVHWNFIWKCVTIYTFFSFSKSKICNGINNFLPHIVDI